MLFGKRPYPGQREPFSLQSLDRKKKPSEEECQADQCPDQHPHEQPSEHGSQQAEQSHHDDHCPEENALEGMEAYEFSTLKLFHEQKHHGRDESEIREGSNPAIV